MSQFTVTVTVMHPEHRERSRDVAFLIDTGATYVVLPPDIVDRLGLEIRMQRRIRLASGELGVWGLGDVRLRPPRLHACRPGDLIDRHLFWTFPGSLGSW